jgi:hypothetical protein
VENALQAVGQTFASLGFPDPRLQPSGKLDLRIHRQLQAYSKQDPPPHRVKPVSLQILLEVITYNLRFNDPHHHTIAQMKTLGFFFLLRPGEYAHTSNPDASPFRLCDVHIMANNVRLNPLTCNKQQLESASHVALEFTTQKNGVRGELIGLGRSGHPFFCPVLATINRLKHLRLHHAHPTTPLYQYFNTAPRNLTTNELTQQLCFTCNILGHTVGINSADISIRSL